MSMGKTKKLKIYFASSNKHKLKEIKSILNSQRSEVRGQRLDRTILLRNAPEGFTINENGKTFLENAYKKASALSRKLKVVAFADDSGIEVSALNGKPGIKSARFFRDGKGIKEILEKLKNKKNRKCCFTCAIVCTDEKGKVIFKVKQSWHGTVAFEPKGENGFGYDPIFMIPKIKKTSAQISSKLKNELSHRALAIKEMGKWLSSLDF